MHALGAGKIEKGFVDRQRLHQRRQRLHGMAHFAADPHIFRHVRRDHDRGRAQRQRLEHRHGRAHAEGAGDVAGGRHHAALAAADDHGLVGDARDCRASRPWRRTRRSRYGRASATAARDAAPGEGSRIRRIAGPRMPGHAGSPGKSRSAPPVPARLRSRHIALPVGIVQRLVGRGDIGGVKLRRLRRMP